MNKWLILFCAFIVFISACGDKTREIEELATKCRKGDSEACKELADIAKNAKWLNDRVVAVEKLSDQKILADIAKNDEARTVRLAAIEKLTDQKILAYIAKNDKEELVRQSAIQNPNLTDQKLLADIAENDKDGGVRGAALEKLSDQKILMYFVQDKENPDRWWAIKKLTDQTMLAKIALEDSFDGDIAFRKLRAQAQLEKTGEVNKDRLVRLIYKFISAFESVPNKRREDLMMTILPAIRVLNYPDVILAVGEIISIKTEYTEIVRSYTGSLSGKKEGEIFSCWIKVQKLSEPISYTWKTDFPFVTHSLDFLPSVVNPMDLIRNQFGKINDNKLLADIAINCDIHDFRLTAVKNLKDQSLLGDIANKNCDPSIRILAVERLTDQKILADLANNVKDEEISKAALGRMTDQKLLAEIVKNKENIERVRKTALGMLFDQTLLTDIAKNNNEWEIRKTAIKMLRDKNIAQAIFVEVARNDKDEWVRKAAVEHLTNEKILTDIVKNDKSHPVRDAAERRLKELKGK